MHIHTYIFYIFLPVLCRLCTRGRRRAGRSTARRRAQMGSASAPWSHRPRTCVTATHAAGSFASSWRRWQLSITHRTLAETTVFGAGTRTRRRAHRNTKMSQKNPGRRQHRLSRTGCWSEQFTLFMPQLVIDKNITGGSLYQAGSSMPLQTIQQYYKMYQCEL